MAASAPDGGIALPPAYDSLAGPTPPSPSREEDDALPRYTPPTNSIFLRLSPLLLPLFLLPLTFLLLFSFSPSEDMSGFITFLKSILLPALLALALYLLLHFALLPLYRRHRARYSQYLPVHTGNSLTDNLSSSAQTLRSQILLYILPSRWAEWRYRRGQGDASRVVDAEDGDEELGEDLGFDVDELGEEERRRRRDGLSLSIEARRLRAIRDGHIERRLSRELEEGFADDSSGSDSDADERRRRRRR